MILALLYETVRSQESFSSSLVPPVETFSCALMVPVLKEVDKGPLGSGRKVPALSRLK